MPLQGNSSLDLRFTLDIIDTTSREPKFVESSLLIAADAGEAFWGFGEQYTYLNQRGRVLRLINMEQGIFRGEEPQSLFINGDVPGTAGDWWTTYIALPQYITSSNRALFFENYEPFVFDLTPSDHVVASGNTTTLIGHILVGDSPGSLLTAYTEHSGRMDPLPDWIGTGSIIQVQGGETVINTLLDKVKAANVSLAAVWIEDWSGSFSDLYTGSKQVSYNWILNRTYYPNWDKLVDTLSAAGTRVMVYLNPFLIDAPGARRNLFAEAEYYGFLVGYKSDTYVGPYLSILISRVGGMIDMSNPYAGKFLCV